MGQIFISYRRADAAGHAGRLCDQLRTLLGADRVFMDVDDIRPGQDFVQAIESRIAASSVVIVVVGPRWLEILRNRAEDEADFVRSEVEFALKHNVTLIPALVGGAAMPPPAQMPAGLEAFSRREAVELRDTTFVEDSRRLGDFIAGAAGRETSPDASLQGAWKAQMEKRGQPPFGIRLNLEVFGDSLYGTVEYPTGEGSIREGKIQGRKFSFNTVHVPQFASEPATIRVEGEIDRDQLRLITADDNGVSRGIATREK